MMITDLREKLGISDDMPYGGMPYSKIIPRYEKTPMNNNINSVNENYDSNNNAYDEDPFENYVRGQIIDWGTDAPLFESDHIKRDPSFSKSNINLRYNGNRGHTADLPRHPDLFVGFTGNDPRGATNDPRMEQMRGFITAHTSNIEPTMGKNDDNHLAERPWTNQSISYDKKYLQKQTANNLKVFSSQKEGNPIGRNINTDEANWGKNQNKIRKSNMGVSNFDKLGGDYNEYVEFGGQINATMGADIQNIKKMKAGSNINKHKIDQNFANHKNGLHIGSGNNYYSNNTNLKYTKSDHISIDSIPNIGTNGGVFNKQSLAASMGLAAKNAATSKQSINQSYNKQGMTSTNDNMINNEIYDNSNLNAPVGYNHAKDIINIYKQIENGQKYNESTEGSNIGGYIQKRTTDINKNVIHDKNTISNRLETVSSIVKGLKENSASSKRKIANKIKSQKSMVENGNNDLITNNSSGIAPATQYKKNIDGIDSALFKKYIDNESKINKFQPAPKIEKRAQTSKYHDINNWNDSNQIQYGQSAKYQEDFNRFNKNKNALDQINWKNSKEMEILKNKNPELYHRVKKDMEQSVMNWKESDIAKYGKISHEKQKNLLIVGQQTYNPETWNNGYAQQQMGKNQQLSNRRSALKDPTEFGTNQDELFKNQYNSSMSYGAAMNSGAKTLRSGKWNGDNFNNNINSNEMNDRTLKNSEF